MKRNARTCFASAQHQQNYKLEVSHVMRRSLTRLPWLLAILVTFCALPLFHSGAQQPANSPSAFTVDDLLDVANLNIADLSDDGRWLAVTSATLRDRIGIDNYRFGDPTYIAPTASDVWIIDTQTAKAQRLFPDKRQVRGLRWSGDGARLALLVLRDGKFTPQIWERATNKWQDVTLPPGKMVAENGELIWAPDGAELLLTVRPSEWQQHPRARKEPGSHRRDALAAAAKIHRAFGGYVRRPHQDAAAARDRRTGSQRSGAPGAGDVLRAAPFSQRGRVSQLHQRRAWDADFDG